MTAAQFPVFDLRRFETAAAAERAALAAELDAICRDTGFLAIVGHGVPQNVIDERHLVEGAAPSSRFARRSEKQRAKAPYPGYPYGYLGPEKEALAKSRNVDSPPDLKESFNGGPLSTPAGLTDAEALAFCYAATIWPQEPAGFCVEAWQALIIQRSRGSRRGSCARSRSRSACRRTISLRSSDRAGQRACARSITPSRMLLPDPANCAAGRIPTMAA